VFAAARRQHGVVSTTQLLAAGWDKDAIARRVASGYLRRLHHGVYLVGPLQSPHARAMAAVLATDGIVSSYPAAVLWDWRPPREGPMHVIAAGRSRPGITVHHTTLHPTDITRRHGIPTTSAARTLLDLAATDPPPSWNARSTRQACSGASARVPSMSSSAGTRTTGERQH